MTQPAQENGKLTLPKAESPVCAKVISQNPFFNPMADATKDPSALIATVMWVLGKEHPFVPGWTIARMYITASGAVDIYSYDKEGKVGVRHQLPSAMIKLTEEVMDMETFVEEITQAESGGEEEEDGLPETPAAVPLVPLNGTPS